MLHHCEDVVLRKWQWGVAGGGEGAGAVRLSPPLLPGRSGTPLSCPCLCMHTPRPALPLHSWSLLSCPAPYLHLTGKHLAISRIMLPGNPMCVLAGLQLTPDPSASSPPPHS